jgi:hypothetical protein
MQTSCRIRELTGDLQAAEDGGHGRVAEENHEAAEQRDDG